MATIASTSKNVLGPFPTSGSIKTALTGADTFTYVSGAGQELILFNTTGSAVPVTLTGSGATSVQVPGAGASTVSVAAGVVVNVAANDFQVVRLDTIPAYLKGTVAVTGGTGVVACILQ